MVAATAACTALFGLKFWAFVVGAAPLDPELEAFWGRLGFRRRPGLRPDRNRADRHAEPSAARDHGARSASRSPASRCRSPRTARSWCAARTSRAATSTRRRRRARRSRTAGSTPATSASSTRKGQLHIRGRKKEMIVTPEGLNVFPEDVERALNDAAGRDGIGGRRRAVPGSTAERVQAVLVARPGRGRRRDRPRRERHAAAIIRRSAPRRVWPDGELPRTEGTRKLKRRELRQWLSRPTVGRRSAIGGSRSRRRGRSPPSWSASHPAARSRRRRRSTSSGSARSNASS